ncbi:MAG: PAS domain S-box protein [Burkholderiales bacterium]|nr:PAS domain S-box protein [Burkholderiales bacterium]
MTPATAARTGIGATLARLRRWLGRWWILQPAARQDRFVTIGPLVSVLLFLAAIISAFWYLRNEEIERETESLKRDTELVQQQLRLTLIENQEQLLRIATELSRRETDIDEFDGQAAAFIRDRPVITQIAWLDADRRRRAGRFANPFRGYASAADVAADPTLPQPGQDNPAERAFARARDLRQPVYSRAYLDDTGSAVFQMQVPLVARNTFVGTLLVEYSIESLLRHYVPPDVAGRHRMEVIDDQRRLLASTVKSMPGRDETRRAPLIYELPLPPAGDGLLLRGEGYRTSAGLISNTLFWMVVALSGLTVWMLLGSWRHLRRRAQIQAALVQETNFRRAMENSMLTGMRAMDLDGRITYVNAAFCAMTGFSESALIGRMPPYPYWPPDRIDENARLLQQELAGRSPAGGIEVRVMRKDGSEFDARMYVSPLIDPRGQQTGWMTSMTNITEAKRIRDQLSASHERFTTVLEGLDASVSVLSVPQGELLFANRSYRLWFGADAAGHALLAGEAPDAVYLPDAEDLSDGLSGLPTEQIMANGAESREVFVAPLQKWFDVRARYLQWTDGRLAQMLIATDITARLRAEAQAAQQAEKAQVASRLVTMGEMASSVAHELNQPLTAITNYCNGMVSRVAADAIAKGDLIAALQKTARQAERAAQVIRRIRSFVRKSEPQRQAAQARQIVEDAVELAGIELRRRNVAIQTYVAQRLPPLRVDPILIEQVLLNLLKNSAEAIDTAGLPAARRNIELRVVPRHTPDEGGVIEFSVTDMGPGLPQEVIARLYEAFFSTKAEGLGIGLSLCRSIVESHRGRMRAQNLYNGEAVVGCRFAFTLPVDLPLRPDAEGAADAATRTPTSNSTIAS